MPEFNFNPALPKPISFKIQDGQYGKQLALFIPTESITHFVDHMQNLVNTKLSSGKVYLDGNVNVDTDSKSIKVISSKLLSVNSFLYLVNLLVGSL